MGSTLWGKGKDFQAHLAFGQSRDWKGFVPGQNLLKNTKTENLLTPCPTPWCTGLPDNN